VPRREAVALITADPTLYGRCKKALARSFNLRPYYIPKEGTKHRRTLLQQLREIIDDVLGTNHGRIDIRAVIIDVCFFSQDSNETTWIDDQIYHELPFPAGSVVAAHNNVLDQRKTSFLAKNGVLFFDAATVKEELSEALGNPPYIVNTLRFQNEFAPHYDRVELSSAGTVSAMIWENEYILARVKSHVLRSNRQVRVLDLGCGTGRFEEVLLSDLTVQRKINRIVAVDFAPMFFSWARRRLAQFLDKTSLKKIHFVRRIAEDLRFPDSYFDIVIAGFGMVCFAHAETTLRNIHRSLRNGGLAIFCGYNRVAMVFDEDIQVAGAKGSARSRRPAFAVSIDRESNLMRLGSKHIQCVTFHPEDFRGLLSFVEFNPVADSTETFPLLYGLARGALLREPPPKQPSRRTRKRWKCYGGRAYASYQSRHLLKDQYDSGFNRTMHEIDLVLTKHLPERGFYFCTTARK
jgi:ubiquinone/menaquinone biosynthesis C-methylase UbiE